MTKIRKLRRTAFFAIAAIATVVTVSAKSSADDRMIPASLDEGQRANLKKYLDSVEKPTQLIPANAKVVGTIPKILTAEPPVGSEVKEYLASVIPDVATDAKKTPERATIYWYRPNPKQGSAGVTIRRVVDLNTGNPVGEPEVLFNHATPLAREERADAVALAYKQSAALRELSAGVDPKDIEVAPLLQVITAAGQTDGAPGDRVVSMQFRNRKTTKRVRLMVNLTQQTVRDPNAR